MKRFFVLILLIFAAACSDGLDEANEGSLALHNINIQIKGNEIQLTAEVNSALDNIYYVIEQGEQLLQEETSISLTKGEGEVSEIAITYLITDDMKDEAEPPIVTIYGKNDEGERISPNYVPIDIGQ